MKKEGEKYPLGAHFSIARGYLGAFVDACSIGATAIQIFSKSPMQARLRSVTADEEKAVREYIDRKSIIYGVIHSSYLINLAKVLPTGAFQFKSLIEDLKNAEKLGLAGVVTHFGKSLELDRKEAGKIYAKNIAEIIKKTPELKSKVILENTAGQGTELGFRFEELGEIFRETLKYLKGADKKRLAVCIDTAHLFGGGYDFSSKDIVHSFLKDFDKEVGLENVECVHLNDSKRELGSRVDRHQDIGYGKIGKKGLMNFLEVLSSLRKDRVPLILETTQEHETFEKQIRKLRKVL